MGVSGLYGQSFKPATCSTCSEMTPLTSLLQSDVHQLQQKNTLMMMMMMMLVCVFKKPTCCVDNVEAGSLVGSPSLAAVLPNRRHPVALWANALGSLDFLENRLLEDRQKESVWSLLLFICSRWTWTSLNSWIERELEVMEWAFESFPGAGPNVY